MLKLLILLLSGSFPFVANWKTTMYWLSQINSEQQSCYWIYSMVSHFSLNKFTVSSLPYTAIISALSQALCVACTPIIPYIAILTAFISTCTFKDTHFALMVWKGMLNITRYKPYRMSVIYIREVTSLCPVCRAGP